VRQDLLDQIVWTEVIRLLEDPTLIQQELDRRLAAARSSDPTKRREQSLQRELTRVSKGIERLLNAYQEELLSLEQLRERMPLLRQREQTLRAELQAIADQATDRATFLRLAETLAAFLGRLRSAADTLDVIERQRIVRLLVKDILIGDDTIVIRHCIPVGLAPARPDSGPATPGRSHNTPGGQSYLLRSGSSYCPLRSTFLTNAPFSVVQDTRLEPLTHEADDAFVADPMLQETDQPFLTDRIEEAPDVDLENPVHRGVAYRYRQGIQRIVLTAPGPKAVREPEEVLLVNRVQHLDHRALDDLIFQGGDPQRALFPARLRYVPSSDRQCPVRSTVDPCVQVPEVVL
jgi:site-specific DNA recombinase